MEAVAGAGGGGGRQRRRRGGGRLQPQRRHFVMGANLWTHKGVRSLAPARLSLSAAWQSVASTRSDSLQTVLIRACLHTDVTPARTSR